MTDHLVLPTFVVIGAMKAGSTSLHRWLGDHPEVYVPDVKEPEFFSEDRNWRRGTAWYSSLFEPGADRTVRGEASTGYSRTERFPETPARMASVVPDARLVYVLRDPIERMRSHYRHSVLMGREQRTVDQALRAGEGYIDASSYARQIRRYLVHFDRTQLLTVFSEDLRADPRATLSRICSFIGCDPEGLPPELSTEQHVSERRRRLPGPLRSAASSQAVLALRRRAPGVAHVVGRVVGRAGAGVDDHPSDATRALLLEHLADDLADLRVLLGTVPETWSAPR